MENKKEILSIIRILQRVTITVKVYPFIYALLYVFCMGAYLFGSETISTILDLLFYTSPVAVVFTLILSKNLKLCKWHRTECVLPMIPLIHLFVDSFIFSLSTISAILNVVTIIVICCLSLVNAYFVFIKPKR